MSHLRCFLLMSLVAACGDDGTTLAGDGGASHDGPADDGAGGEAIDAGPTGDGSSVTVDASASDAGPAAGCTQPTTVACVDEVMLQLNLQAEPAPGLITSAGSGGTWTSQIDATAGGAFASTPDSYVYGRFTAEGLVKVEISDAEALTSMDWDIGFRRFIVRINSGDSGPSCVQAASAPEGATFQALDGSPGALVFTPDDFMNDACELVPDAQGLGSPATALSSYWSYASGCVAMRDQVFVLSLADGRHVKLIVDSYYTPEVQEQCDTTGTIPMTNTGAANFVVRWAFLD